MKKIEDVREEISTGPNLAMVYLTQEEAEKLCKYYNMPDAEEYEIGTLVSRLIDETIVG